MNESMVNESERLEYAKFYIEKMGFGLCMFDTGTKGPNTNGWNTPRLYIDSIEKAERELARKPSSSMGVIHEASNTVCIDVDHLEWFTLILEEFGIDAQEIINSGLRISSGRPNRAKALFRKPASLTNCRNKSLNWPNPDKSDKAKTTITVFELRGGPVQDVLPPSIHPDTKKPYVWVDDPAEVEEIPELPEIFTQLWVNWDKLKPQLQDVCPWKETTATPPPPPIQRQSDGFGLKVINAFNDAHDPRLMLLGYGYQQRGKRLLCPSSTTKLAGVVFFEEGRHFFSHHASDIFGDGKRHDAFDVFMTYDCQGSMSLAIQKAALLLGIGNESAAPMPDFKVDLQALRPTKPGQKKEAQPLKIPESILNPPGILNEIAQQIVHTARMPQPIFAVNAALILVSTLMARRVQGPTGLRTNLYIVSLGPTGCGKEHARNYIKNALNELGRSGQLAGEDIASGQGLMSRAGMTPDAVFQIDEFGDFLAAATEKNAGSFKLGILTNFMKLFSSTSSIITGTEYANQKMNERQLIEFPCVNLHATGTDGVFYDALSGRHIFDGYLNRLIVTETDEARPKKQRTAPSSGPTDKIVEWHGNIKEWLSEKGGMLADNNPKHPVTIEVTPEAWELFDALENQIDLQLETYRGTGLDSLFVRVWEHAHKVALVCACAKNEPKMTEVEAKYGIEYVTYWNNRLVEEAKLRIADSEFGSLMNLIIMQLRKADDWLSKGRLFNHKKLRETPPMLRDQLLAALVENGEIVLSQKTPEKTGGRPAFVYAIAEKTA